MTRNTITTCRLECDEQTLNVYVYDGNDDSPLVAVPWPAELYDLDGEPDYDWLTEVMAEAVERTLGDKGFRVVAGTNMLNTVRVAVTPGGPVDDFRLFKVETVTSYTPQPDDDNSPDAVLVPFKDDNGVITVDIQDTDRDGNRRTDVPSIYLGRDGRWSVMLTWQEARALAQALNDVTDTAEFG